MSSTQYVNDFLLSDAERHLVRILGSLLGCVPSDDAFAAWLIGATPWLPPLNHLCDEAIARAQQRANYQDVAVLGFGLAEGLTNYHQSFSDGLRWLIERQPIVDDNPMPFVTDGVALLGIALGVSVLSEEGITAPAKTWMSRLLEAASSIALLTPEYRCFQAAATGLLRLPVAVAMPGDLDLCDLRLSLAQKMVVTLQNNTLEADRLQLLTMMTRTSNILLSLTRIACVLCAYRAVRASHPVIPPRLWTAQDVINLLTRIPAALKNWTWEGKPRVPHRPGAVARQWHIDHEYHVQNILFALLAPVFTDLKDEENLPSVGQKKPRADLYIPSMRLIVEVKYIYSTTRFPDVIEAIAADTGLYLAESRLYKDTGQLRYTG